MDAKEREAVMRQRMQDTIKLDPKVPFRLGDHESPMVFNNRAVKEILKETGLNLLTSALTTEELLKPDVLGWIVFWGLKQCRPDVTMELVDEHLTARHTLYFQSQIITALQLFYPDVEDLPKLSEPKAEDILDPTSPPLAHG